MTTMKKTITLILIIAVTSIFALFDDYEPSPVARALGGTYHSYGGNSDAVFYNPAGLSFAGNQLRTSYTEIFQNDFQKLMTMSLSTKLPKKFGTIAFGYEAMKVEYLDVDMLTETVYTFGHSFTLMKDVHSEIHLGYNIDMYHASIDGFGNQTSLGLDFGAVAVLHTRTYVGFSISNINNPKVGVNDDYDLPQKMTIGISYLPYDGVVTSLELKKGMNGISDETKKTEIHAGCEATLFEVMTLRMGLRNNPASFSAGLGLNIKNILVDYAFNTHTLDATHHFGLGYKF